MGNLDAFDAWPDFAPFQGDFIAKAGMGELDFAAPGVSYHGIHQDFCDQSDLPRLPGGGLAEKLQWFTAHRLDCLGYVPGGQLRQELNHIK